MYHLFTATPEKQLFEDDVISLIAPGTEGYLEILTNHAPILTSLGIGKLTVLDKSKKKWVFAITGGVLEASHNKAALLLDSAELGSSIDIRHEEEVIKRERKKLELRHDEAAAAESKALILLSENRIKAAEEYQHRNRFNKPRA